VVALHRGNLVGAGRVARHRNVERISRPTIALGASGAFESVFGSLAQLVALDWVTKNLYFRVVRLPGLTWEVVLLGGVFIGGALGAISSRTWKLRWLPDEQWTDVFGQSRITRWVLVFLGAILLEYGAGIAGGCTSGLAIWADCNWPRPRLCSWVGCLPRAFSQH